MKNQTTLTRDQEIAGEILRQLGGRSRLEVMIGARHVFAVTNGVTFAFRGSKTFTHVRITLEGDTYLVHLMKIRGTTFKAEDKTEMVYADSLKTLLESKTGLRLSL